MARFKGILPDKNLKARVVLTTNARRMDMRTLITAKDTLINPNDETVQQEVFGFLNDMGITVISPFAWRIVCESGEHLLCDARGCSRPIQRDSYHRAIEFPDWRFYDAHETSLALEKAKKEIEDLEARLEEQTDRVELLEAEANSLRRRLAQIYDVSEVRGDGSWKSVREIAAQAIDTRPCGVCKHVACTCAR